MKRYVDLRTVEKSGMVLDEKDRDDVFFGWSWKIL